MLANPVGSAPLRPPAADDSLRMVCSEIFGGNRPINVPIDLPGIRGALYSAPCAGGRGGDVHYLSVCSSGLLTRGCIADVAGHGPGVAAISGELHDLMRRFMNHPDQRRVLMELNRRIARLGFRAMTTAAAFTYYPPGRSLSLSYAGHPPAWIYRRATGRWERFSGSSNAAPESTAPLRSAAPAYFDLPLGVENTAQFSRHRLRVAPGDRLVVLTDGILEAPAPGGELFGEARLQRVLERGTPQLGPAELAAELLNEVRAHIAAGAAGSASAAGGGEAGQAGSASARGNSEAGRAGSTPTTGGAEGGSAFAHDDVTLLVAEFVPPPRGPALWQVLRNRLLRPRGNSAAPRFAAAAATPGR